ncbi:hypothetical protein CDL15_Pgr000794 [Punica granatum]|uniref:TOG domain-containing protein n=1 Tax=Punica granatum TaxID=22663 RepID=A0A218W5G7_PUNGR|nr:hypothetical protein CDL15_Pgr000794 [Punica granatum]
MADSIESVASIAGSVSTSSTKQRIQIFRNQIPFVISNSEMSPELASILVEIIFKTLFLYDDLHSTKAVEAIIVKGLGETAFKKSFAAALVQTMEKQAKAHSHASCYRLLKWSCILLGQSQFAAVSKNAVCRVAAAQASLLTAVMKRSFRERRACKQLFFHLFSKSPSIYKIFIEELKNARISHKDSADFIFMLLEYSSENPSLFEEYKPVFLDVYAKAVLNAREKPAKSLSEAFHPLFRYMSHEEFQNTVVPSSVKMLKRNPEIVLESVGVLLKLVNLDLSKYAVEILSVVLPQARHADEGRRVEALAIIRSLSQKSSNPDAVEAMFNAIKAVIGGSEGRLAFPYQRTGMINALQELSLAPEGKYIHSLSRTICSFLLSSYKSEGNEEVKLAILFAIASWAARSADAVDSGLVSFFSAGLKEKEVLRRGHLRCLRIISGNSDAIMQISSLLGPLVQLVKTGFTKAAQRLDGLYALLLVGKIAAADIKAEETVTKEKIWSLISQNEPSLVPLSMASKLSVEDCMLCVDLLEVLLVEHQHRMLEAFSSKPLLQSVLFLICHPNWDIRKMASDATRKIIAASPQLSEPLLLEFTQFLSVVSEKVSLLKTSDTENQLDAQVPNLASTEVLVKALLVTSSSALAASSSVCMQRLQKCLQKHALDITRIISTDVSHLCKGLLGPKGLMNPNPLEQQAAVSSLATLMSINPRDTYLEFEKHLGNLPDRSSHDMLSESDIQIFRTPEGMLSNEQGVYVAESVASKNTKLAKGRFRLYDDQDDTHHDSNSHVVKREPANREASNIGRKDSGKPTKRTDKGSDKGKTAKEEARELLLKEEASIREKVREIQKNLSVMLRALGEIAIANPIFAHSQLPSLVKFVNPLLRSPIVGDVAYETLVKLARCTASPLCNWALEIATALRLIVTEENGTLFDELTPIRGEGNEKHQLSLFERVINALSLSCKSGGLPVDSFTFVFPALYNVLGVVPAYQASAGSALNELCLGLQPDEVAPALYGVYAKDVHVRMACLNAVKCVPSVANCTLPENVEVATGIWIALHDPEKSVAEVAEDIWDRYGYNFGTDYSGIYRALSNYNYNVRLAAAEALAAALDENPDTIQEALSTLFSLYIRDANFKDDIVDAGWLGRQGIALALYSAADVIRTKDLPVVMTFLISRALADPNADVRGRMINAGIMVIDKHGKENVSLLFPIFENYLNKEASDEETYDLVREGVVIFTGALAKHLAKDDPKVHTVVEKLLDVLNTPSEAVQRAVSVCLSPLMQSKREEGQALVSRLLDQLMKSDKYGERRGAAFGLAGVVKGFGISCLKKYGIVDALREGLVDRNSAKRREGALMAFECLCEKLGKLFEPYVIQMLPLLLVSFSDQVVAVREGAECAARAMMSQMSAQGVKLVLPSLLKGLEDKAWRTKQSSVQLLGAMAYCAPQQLSQCLPKIVPKLTEVLTDTHPKVQSAGQTALQQVGSVIKNPEISSLVPTLLMGLTDPNDHTKYSLDILLQTTFVNSIDAPSLALLVPIVHRGLRERSADTKKKAAQIVGNMCSLVTEPKDMIPYIGLLLPEVKKVLVDPIPEVRSVAARALGSLIRGMGEENFPDLVPWLLDTLKSDGSNVERSGAAQGLTEVLAALGVEYFENLLPDVIRNCSHQKASVRDGYLTLFKYFPRSLGVQFQNYLPQVLPAILDGLADENESVREAALGAGHVLVEHYATTSLPLLLPAVEDGIFNDSWRIRQSSVELLGDLLFKVAGTSGKALLEGGSDDEGASTEAHGRAIIEVLGKDKRNEVLAALYMVRTDVSLSVRQAALHVWKTIVANTPKTLKEIMPVLMNTLITSLASSSSERRQVAGRSLGELVRKLGERVLPLIIPILAKGLEDPTSSRRQGVCIGLSEVMASAGRSQLLSFMDELIPTIRTALCDSTPEVREAAGLAFSTLYKSAGMQAIDEIVPTLLHALEDDETSDTALDGLKQILSVRTAAVLPHILPKLVNQPLSAFNAHALGALAEVAGAGLNFHLGTVLPALLSTMGGDDSEVQPLAKEAAETVVLVIDEEGIDTLLSELLKGVSDSQASIRRSSAYLIGYLFKNSKLYLVDEAPNMISTLIVLLSDSDSATVSVSWEALSSVVSSVPKEVLPSYIKLVRDAVSTARDKERRRKKGGPVLVPGFCLRKALQPVLPMFHQGLISGSAELREQAALGLGELIEVTSEQALKEFVIPITGTVRSSAALALGKLSALSTRVDPLVGDLLTSLQASEGGVQEAILIALRGVLKHAGKSVSAAVRTRVYNQLRDLILHDDDQVRISSAKILGIISQYMEEEQLNDLFEELLKSSSSSSWSARHGSLLTILWILMHNSSAIMGSRSFSSIVDFFKSGLKDEKGNPSIIVANISVVGILHDDDQVRISSAKILGIISQYMEEEQLNDLFEELLKSSSSSSWSARHGSLLTILWILMHNSSAIMGSRSFSSIVDFFKSGLKDEKFPIRETSTKALGRLLLCEIQTSPGNNSRHSDLISSIVSALRDDSSEVRRRALSAIKSLAKGNPSIIVANISVVGPAVAECLKDGSMPVKLAAERCSLHVFQLTKAAENVQAAQKYITGLDARRLSKLPELSDESEDSENDSTSG